MIVRKMNCGTMRPRGAGVFAPQLSSTPCNCLLIETEGRLILVDSGLGTADMLEPGRLGRSNLILNAQRDLAQTAVRQIEGLGFLPEDVESIVCTHLDRDHAGGLPDFPRARVHVLEKELDAALNPETRGERDRYRSCHFEHGPEWVTYHTDPDPADEWYGMDCIRELPGLPGSILLVPLQGHTRGHCGVAVETAEGWLLHCGDAYYVREELVGEREAPLGVRCFRSVAHEDRSKARSQLTSLRRLRDSGEITLLASHDPEVACDV